MSAKPAARVNDPTACPLPGHGHNPITAGSPDVLIEGLPAARLSDPTGCGSTLNDGVMANVLINGKPVAVMGSRGSHGNTVTAGAGTVLIGTTHSPAAFAPPLAVALADYSQCILIEDQDGNPLPGIPYRLRDAQGQWIEGHTDSAGRSHRVYGNPEDSIDFLTAIQGDPL